MLWRAHQATQNRRRRKEAAEKHVDAREAYRKPLKGLPIE